MNRKKTIFTITILVALLSSVLYWILSRTNDTNDLKIDKYLKTYEDLYSFDEDKPENNIYLSFTGIQDPASVISLISEINSLDVDLSNIKTEYKDLLKKDYKIIQVESKENIFSTTEINDNPEEAILNETSDLVKHDFVDEKRDFIFTGQLAEDNTFNGYLSRYYISIINDIPVLNFGSVLEGNIQKDETISGVTLNQNLQGDWKETKEIGNTTPMSFSEFSDLVDSKKQRLYKVGNLGGLTYLPIQIINIKENAKLKAKSISVEYLYMEKYSAMTPLLRINSTLDTSYGEQEVSFWVWFIE